MASSDSVGKVEEVSLSIDTSASITISPVTGLPRSQRDIEYPSRPNITEGFGSAMTGYYTSFCRSIQGIMDTPTLVKNEMTYFRQNPWIFLNQFFTGLSLGIILVPESISFAYMVGLPPSAGLFSTFWVCIISSLFGARPGLISATAGSVCAVVKTLTSAKGPLQDLPMHERWDAVYIATILSGVIQLLIAMLKGAGITRLIPASTMYGFINSLAIYVLLAQQGSLKRCEAPPGEYYKFTECPDEYVQWMGLGDQELWFYLILFFFALLVNYTFDRIPYVGKLFPPILIALVSGALVEHFIFRPILGVQTRTLDETAPVVSHFPAFGFPAAPSGYSAEIITTAVFAALVSTLESVATVQSLNERLNQSVTDRDANKEAFSQGLGNLFSGLFSGFGGCAVIAESNLNILNGGVHRLSTIVSSLVVIGFMLFLAPVVNLVPLASLVGSVVSVVLVSFEWKNTFRSIRYRKSDAISLILVTVISVATNLVYGMVTGFIIAATNSVLDNSKDFKIVASVINISDITDMDEFYYTRNVQTIYARSSPILVDNESGHENNNIAGNNNLIKVYNMIQPLFFGSSTVFKNYFKPQMDPLYVILDFSESTLTDLSSTNSIAFIAGKYVEAGRVVKIIGLNEKSELQIMRDQSVLHYLAKVAPGEYRVRSKEEIDMVVKYDEYTEQFKRCVKRGSSNGSGNNGNNMSDKQQLYDSEDTYEPSKDLM